MSGTTAKAPVPFVPETFTMPSLVVVTANATMSGTGVFDAESNSVLRPVLTGAGFVFEQSKLNWTSVGAIGEFRLKAKTKLCPAPGGMFTGVFGLPMS
jgi:hypothetical protein